MSSNNSTNSKQSTNKNSAKEQSKEPFRDTEIERRKTGRTNKRLNGRKGLNINTINSGSNKESF